MRAEFMVDRNGKQFVLYAGLLDEAHKQGLTELRTNLLQIPDETNGHVAIVYATAVMGEDAPGKKVRTFTGIGDASPANVARAMVTCTIRLAETRAKARALRDAVNVGTVAFEEIGDNEPEAPDHGANHEVGQGTARPSPQPADRCSEAQRRMITNLCRERGVELPPLATLNRIEASALINKLKSGQG